MQKEKPIWIIYGVLLLLAFIWGTSFILMKLALFNWIEQPVYAAMDVAAMRILFAAIALLPVAIMQFSKVPKDKLIWILGVGAFGNLFPAYLFSSAQTELASGMTGMLNSLTPLFTLIIAILLFKTTFSLRQLAGLLLGFIGAIILISDGGNILQVFSSEADISIIACGKVALATVFYGLSVNILKNKLGEVNATAIAAISLSMVMPVAIIALIGSDVPDVLVNNPHGVTGMISVLVLAVIGTASALVIFNALIKWTDALTASSVTYVIPVFAAMWGWIVGEDINEWHLLGGVVILLGVALVQGLKSGKK